MQFSSEAYGRIRGSLPFVAIAGLLAWCWLLPNVQQMFARFDVVLRNRHAEPRLRLLGFAYQPRWALLLAGAVVVCLGMRDSGFLGFVPRLAIHRLKGAPTADFFAAVPRVLRS